MTEYRIDDLARAAGTTARNVRAYQERGLLPPPEKRGRVGYYNDSHLARLKLIDSLLSRGFTTAHIQDFITSWETGNDIAEVLGLEDTLTERWAQGETMRLPRELVGDVLGAHDDAVIERLVPMGLVRIDGDDCVLTEPELLKGFAELRQFGLAPRPSARRPCRHRGPDASDRGADHPRGLRPGHRRARRRLDASGR